MSFNYIFKNAELFQISMNHPSLSKHNKLPSYERMEFLGDSILNVVIAIYLYKRYPNFSEGQLSRISANLVSANTVTKIADQLQIATLIKMSVGEECNGGRNNSSNLGNAMEALIGAIYLDSNFITVQRMIHEWWKDYFTNTSELFEKDNKSKLQEITQKKYKTLPEYKVISKIGTSHRPEITISLSIHNIKTIYSSSNTKKSAEQIAAKKMLTLI